MDRLEGLFKYLELLNEADKGPIQFSYDEQKQAVCRQIEKELRIEWLRNKFCIKGE